DVPFEAASDYLYVAEGDYDVIVMVAGTGTVAIGPATVSLASGSTYTVVARENAEGSGFGVPLLDDFIIN
ncbi:MAG: hypothetical protein R3280_06865, partial [Marinobacter sp.]|uniref:DUF4397 domain-containing protein n=1 Tax=Marinobacter sp. TaxID=50741 RepID=UPI00299D8738